MSATPRVVALVLGSMIPLAASSCRHVTDPIPTAVGTPTASMAPGAIIERYKQNPKLGDELFDGKLVYIKGFRVDEADAEHLRMKEDGFEIRIDRPGDRKKIYVGDTVSLYCEGEGLENDTLIAFDGCRSRL